MAGSGVTPKTWKSPRDLAYVPPPQTVKLSSFLNISIYSAVAWPLLFPVFFGGGRGGEGKGWMRRMRNVSKDSWDGSRWKNWQQPVEKLATD